MKFATTFAAMMIAGMLPLASASEPASAKVFDWSLTGPAPDLGGVPFPGSGTIDASPTASTGVWAIDTITNQNAARSLVRAFRGRQPGLHQRFWFTSTVGIFRDRRRARQALSFPGNADWQRHGRADLTSGHSR